MTMQKKKKSDTYCLQVVTLETCCESEISLNLILLSDIGASAMARNRERAFSLPIIVGCK